MYTYLFEEKHHNHFYSYHPFVIDKKLYQEDAIKMMKKEVPWADRTGADMIHLFRGLEKNNYQIDKYHCPCCGSVVVEIKNPKLEEWEVIEGISGNY